MAGPGNEAVERPRRREYVAPEPAPTPAPTQEPTPAPTPQRSAIRDRLAESNRAPVPPVASDPLPEPRDDQAEPPVGHDIAAEVPRGFEEDDYERGSSFAHEPPFKPRRNWTRIWTIGAVAFALAAAAVIGAINYFGLPGWMPFSQPTFVQAPPDLVLEFRADRQERRTLPNGIEYFETSGTVTNVGTETRRLPPIKVVLRDSRDRIVYDAQIVPPVSELAPGESIEVNEAIVDVPTSAKISEFGWAAY